MASTMHCIVFNLFGILLFSIFYPFNINAMQKIGDSRRKEIACSLVRSV